MKLTTKKAEELGLKDNDYLIYLSGWLAVIGALIGGGLGIAVLGSASQVAHAGMQMN